MSKPGRIVGVDLSRHECTIPLTTAKDPPPQPRLTSRVIVSLLVDDLVETVAFYCGLGFRITGEYGSDEGYWAEVTRDDVSIQFFDTEPEGLPDKPVLSGTIYFFPDDVRALAEEWKDKVDFEWGPEVMPYGMLEFGIKDPNGYFLAFTEPAE